jgi:cyclomaltodextrinase
MIHHISEHVYAYPVSPDTLNVRIKVKKDLYERISVHYKNLYDHTPHIKEKEMSLILEDEKYRIYEASISVKERHFKYYFKLEKVGEAIHYTADGLKKEIAPENFFYYPAINLDDVPEFPGWAEGEIIYQVLIDRFHDGNPRNNPEKLKDIHELPDRNTYYGGDFAGLIQKLDYVKSLGVKLLYLSPLFSSPTYHKYDVDDYYKIDSVYGSEEELKELVGCAHERGIKVILDGIFNHCSSENPLFQNVLKNGENSPYKDWFYIENFPVDPAKLNYDSFAGQVPSMPRFNTSNPEVIDYLCEAACHWTEKLGIDGWRFDVADEVASGFWREMRKRLRKIKKDVILIGEVWNQAGKWLQGDQLDTVTNYKYRQYLLEFIDGKLTSKEFFNQLNALKSLYKTPFHNYLVNLLGSHDTIRLATYLKRRHPDALRLHYLSLAVTLAMAGMPLIYYGDEIALEGDVDPDNRRAFLWERTEEKPVQELKKLTRFRAASEILKKGSLIPLDLDERVLAFRRAYGGESLLVLANFADAPKEVGVKAREIVYGNAEIGDNVLLDKYAFTILK